MFIELTLVDFEDDNLQTVTGEKVLVNSDHITSIGYGMVEGVVAVSANDNDMDEDGAAVPYYVTESYSDILSILRRNHLVAQ